MKTLKLIVALAIFIPGLVFASYMPRVYLGGYAGSSVLGKADILAPIFLTANKNFFAYAQGKYAYEKNTWQDDTWTGSLALGYRQIANNVAVLGAYVFGDYTTSNSGHDFWLVSPGIEALFRTWEFRANGYFPVSTKRWVNENWASEFGDYRYVEFTQHKQYDHLYKFYQETGHGVDAEAGLKLFKFKGVLVKGFLNGYYYDMEHNDDVTGIGARVTIQPTTYLKLSLHDSYDNYEHNTFLAGAQVSLYDLFSARRTAPVNENDLQQRMFDPIERNFGTLGTGSSIPVTQGDKPEDAGRALVHDNIWFFRQGATGSNEPQGTGTYEDPFTAFTMAESDYIAANYQNIGATIDQFPLMYFNSGTYPLTDFSYRFNLQANWGMYGWELYNVPIEQPATEDTRPLFIGGLQMNSNTSINDLRLQNDMAETFLFEGIKMDSAINVAINNSEVGTNADNTGYVFSGILMDHNSTLTISNSQIYGFDSSDAAAGIIVENGAASTITAINNSIIQGTSVNDDGYGILLQPTNNVTNMGSITGDGTASFVGIGKRGYGLYTAPDDTVTIQIITGSNFIGTGGSEGYGFYATSGSNLTIGAISSSNFTGIGEDRGCGLYAESSSGALLSIENINNSEFTGTGTAGDGYGLLVFGNNSSPVTIESINGSDFTGTGTAGDGYGLYAFGNNSSPVTLESINGSNFTGTGTGSIVSGCGLYVSNGYSNPELVKIGNITDSNFTGTGSGSNIGGCGLYALSNSGGLVSIGDISNSKFIGSGSGPNIGGCGLYAKNDSKSVDIGDISGSSFSGTATTGNAYGLYAESNLKSVDIGDITSSSFSGTATAGDGYGIYTKSTGTTVGNIINTIFTGTTGDAYWG